MHLGSSRSSGVAGVCPCDHPGPLNLLGFALGRVEVIRNRCVYSSALGVVGFIRGHWGAQLGHRVHPVSLGTLDCALRHVHRCWVHLAVVGLRRGVHRVHKVSQDSLGYALVVVWFIRGGSLGGLGFIWCSCVHSGAPSGYSGSSRVAGLIGVHPGGHRVRMRS